MYRQWHFVVFFGKWKKKLNLLLVLLNVLCLETTSQTRKELALAAFEHTADYDSAISGYLRKEYQTMSHVVRPDNEIKYLKMQFGKNISVFVQYSNDSSAW